MWRCPKDQSMGGIDRAGKESLLNHYVTLVLIHSTSLFGLV